MVTNYTPDKCKYTIGKLVKSVWLISEESIKDIRIDNGEAWVNSISETPIRIDCTTVGLQEEESLDERYKFVHTLTFSVNGYANSDDFQGKYYAIVKDNNGTYWLVNPLFPCKVTYTYTLGNEENHTDFTLSTASNHPVLRLNGMVDSIPYQCKDYFIDGIDELWLNEKRYTVHEDNAVKYTNDGFKVIDYNRNTATFTETFDGAKTNHQIDFDVLFSQYKSSWHYNLLEIVDDCIKNNNLYSAVIKTRNGNYAMCGFSFGLQPSFKISADDTTQELNRIQITLQDAHDVGDAIELFDTIDYEYLSAKTWVYTDDYDGYECVADGEAKYLLQKEVDALGNDTCNYKVLEGYEDRFPMLNIVGTFSDIVTFASNECRIEPCRLSTSLPDRIVFNEVGSQLYTIRAGSDWTITHDPGISVYPESGTAGTDYVITVYNPFTPTSTAWTTSMEVNYCSGQEYQTTISVFTDEDSCFQNGLSYNISANAQTLTIPTQCCVQKVSERTGVGVVTSIYSTYLTVYVPQNNSGIERTIILLVEFCDGGATNITINQSNLFEDWVDDHTICIGRSKYMLQYKYIGTSPDHCDTRTDETRTVLVETDSEDCVYEYRWVLSDQTDCVDYDEYYLYQRQVRAIDSLDPWANVVPAEYSIDGYGTMERVLLKKKSVNCGWTNYAMYRWVDTDEGECIEVKECEDYDQLNVPVNIRDGVIVDNKVSSVYNVSDSETGRVYSNVAEILIDSDLYFDAAANEVAALNTGLTIGNDVISNAYTKNVTGRTVVLDSKYQTLVGCGVRNLHIYASVIARDVYKFTYLLKDTPLDGYSFNGSTAQQRIPIYVQDWAVTSLRAEYTQKGQSDSQLVKGEKYPIILPITDSPVPIVLTEYKALETSGYVCEGVDKYKALEVLNSSGTVLANDVKGTLIERYSSDCGYVPMKLTVYDSGGTESRYIDCDTGKTLTQTEVLNSISNKSAITSATVNICVQIIGTGCFSEFENMESITLENGLTTIGDNAFFYCNSLTGVTIPDSVTTIGMRAFQHCVALPSCIIGNGVTSIGFMAFFECRNLTSCTIGSGVTNIGESAFTFCESLSNITIPNSVTSIGDGVFANCGSLSSVTIGNSLTNISEYAFYRCYSLSSITIPNSVTNISNYAFMYCSSLTSCTIGSGVTNIEKSVFYECYSLESIICSGMTAPTIDDYTFSRVKTGGTLYVPIGSSGYTTWILRLPSGWTLVEQ